MRPALARADALRRDGRLDDAELLYRTLLIDDPAEWRALVGIGVCARLRRDLVASAAHLSAAFALAPSDCAVRLEYATTLREQGRLDTAEPIYCGLLADEPDWWPAQAGLGLCARARGDLESATRHLAVATAQARDFALWTDWFEAERLRGDPARIGTCLAAAQPRNAAERLRLWEARGKAAAQSWQLDEAATALAEALVLAPDRGDLHEARARISLLRLDIAAARTHLRLMQHGAVAGVARPAHTHLGNILDDYVIDTAALAALKQSQSLAGAARVGCLRALVRANPDHTATAIALLLALREASRSPRAPSRIESALIPPIICRYADVASPVDGWDAREPAWQVRRFDHAAACSFLQAHAAPDVLDAFRRTREAAVRADVFRLAFLSIEGGCFAETAERFLLTLDSLFPDRVRFVAVRDSHGALGTEFLAATPGHPLLANALRQATLAINRGDGDMRWLATGPGLLARSLAHLIAESPIPPADIHILECHELERIFAV